MSTDKTGFEVPEQMRDFAEKSVDQARKAFDALDEQPDWFDLTAAGDNVARDIWRQVADELAKADGGLRIFTPDLGFDRLENTLADS